jgi:hypothetical protein
MRNDKNTRAAGHRIGLLSPLIAIFAMLLVCSVASAAPKGKFAIFSDCPTSTPEVALCIYSTTTSGEVTIGTSTVPIEKTITLKAGGIETGINSYLIVPAKDGNTLSKTELTVPGGLAGLISCTEIKGEGLIEKTARATCKTTFENGVTGVTATTELVANASNPAIMDLARLLFEEGTGLTLPIRVHLKNPLLGEGCFIGSEAHPINLHLTTGATSPPAPNKRIKGKAGELTIEEEHEQELVVLANNTLVDNSFSAPTAEGCGGLFAFLIDPIIDVKLGLPSASGHNTAILTGTVDAAKASSVVASESF